MNQIEMGHQQANAGILKSKNIPEQREKLSWRQVQSSMARQKPMGKDHLWKPSPRNIDVTSVQAMLKMLRGILNKVTPSKFDRLLESVQKLPIDTEDRLSGAIQLFFEKAVDEPMFSSTYAQMCAALSSKQVTSSTDARQMTNFRKLLLDRCQKEFEKDTAALQQVQQQEQEIENAGSHQEKKELQLLLDEAIRKNRRRSLGNIRFVGELFKLKMISDRIMHRCVGQLLAQSEDEESLEALCQLLTTIGKELEKSRQTMDGYVAKLSALIRRGNVSNRIRFMMQDVIDMRARKWKPRRDDGNKPKTIDQIHQDIAREREEQLRQLTLYQSTDNPAPAANTSVRYDNIGQRNLRLDMKKLQIPKVAAINDEALIFGPGAKSWSKWAKGSSSAE